MFNLISVNNGIAFAEIEKDDEIRTIEIISAFCVVDAITQGTLSDSAWEFLEDYTEVSQDFEKEANVIEITSDDATTGSLFITVDGCELIENEA